MASTIATSTLSSNDSALYTIFMPKPKQAGYRPTRQEHAEDAAVRAKVRQMLVAWRKRRGLSQQALADRLGIVQSAVHDFETRDRSRLDTIERFAGALGLRVEYRIWAALSHTPVYSSLDPADLKDLGKQPKPQVIARMDRISPERAEAWARGFQDAAARPISIAWPAEPIHIKQGSPAAAQAYLRALIQIYH